MMSKDVRESSFFTREDATHARSLAIISLKRDQQMPVILRDPDGSSGDPITNTRFGSYPHSTLVDKSWGSQVIATNVNASDIRKGRKRKHEALEEDDKDSPKENDTDTIYEAASRGFAHVLPPTPELWTVSLPHRTQVVYTPDYSFVLQKLNVRPGDTLIEAGAGSGSFTHAAARAVFNGYSSTHKHDRANGNLKPRWKKRGKVYSFEYHEPRAKQLKREILEHDLDAVVHITHRDVYETGFLLEDGMSPEADAIFLDLPEPRRALEHLVRSPSDGLTSALNPNATTRLCTFSPCIEQVQQTIEAMRRLGWIEIETFEIQHKRIDVRRDMVSLNYEGLRGVNASAADVGEAITKLKELGAKITQFHESSKQEHAGGKVAGKKGKMAASSGLETKKERLDRIKEEDKQRKIWREGRLVHKTEPELKTHTSYLTFAVLPILWSMEDEQKTLRKWSARSA